MESALSSVLFSLFFLTLVNSQITRPAPTPTGNCPPASQLKPCKCQSRTITCFNVSDSIDFKNISQSLATGNRRWYSAFELTSSSVKTIPDTFDRLLFGRISITNNKRLVSIGSSAFTGSANSANVFNVEMNRNLTGVGVFKIAAKLNSLERLIFSRNGLTELISLPKLVNWTYTYLRENQFETIGQFIFDQPRLKVINLGRNRISFINSSAIVLGRNLTSALIHLDGNQLNDLSFADNWLGIDELRNSSRVDVVLSRNEMTRLDESVFGYLFSEDKWIALTLEGNRFGCGCDVKWIVEKKEQLKGRIRMMKCRNGKDVFQLNVDDFKHCN